jgi:pSer/pThr/pTyr-binding forkhead associated (FHA) protein
MPTFTPVAWSAVVGTDRDYYDKMQRTRKLTGPAATFPAASNERSFQLEGRQMRIGRRSAARGVEPEIDLAGPAADPGVSRLHAVLVCGPDGSWSLLDTGSANGTLLNGHEITVGDTIPLRDGDRINLGAWTVITVRHG